MCNIMHKINLVCISAGDLFLQVSKKSLNSVSTAVSENESSVVESPEKSIDFSISEVRDYNPFHKSTEVKLCLLFFLCEI